MAVRHGPRSDFGMTLAELLVATALFGVVAVSVATSVIVAMQTTRGVTSRSNDLDAAQTAVDAMSKAIRTAGQPPPPTSGGTRPGAIVTATPTDIAFYGYTTAGTPPWRFEFVVSGTSLLERIAKPIGAGCTLPISYRPSTTRTIATDLVGGQAVFDYATQTNPPILGGTPLPATGTPPALPAASLADVEIVGISISVQQPTLPGVGAMTATTTVALPNHLVSAQALTDVAC